MLDGAKKARGDDPAVEHKSSISDCNLARVDVYFRDVLESGDAVKLTQYCRFNLSLHFALRGEEVQVRLRKDDVVFVCVCVWTVMVKGTQQFLGIFSPKMVKAGLKGLSFRAVHGRFSRDEKFHLHFENLIDS